MTYLLQLHWKASNVPISIPSIPFDQGRDFTPFAEQINADDKIAHKY